MIKGIFRRLVGWVNTVMSYEIEMAYLVNIHHLCITILLCSIVISTHRFADRSWVGLLVAAQALAIGILSSVMQKCVDRIASRLQLERLAQTIAYQDQKILRLTQLLPVQIFRLNDCEWWAGRTPDECVEAASEEYGLPFDEICDNWPEPYRLTDEEMEKTTFYVETDDPEMQKMTFRARLQDLIAQNERFPRRFASTEE